MSSYILLTQQLEDLTATRLELADSTKGASQESGETNEKK